MTAFWNQFQKHVRAGGSWSYDAYFIFCWSSPQLPDSSESTWWRRSDVAVSTTQISDDSECHLTKYFRLHGLGMHCESYVSCLGPFGSILMQLWIHSAYCIGLWHFPVCFLMGQVRWNLLENHSGMTTLYPGHHRYDALGPMRYFSNMYRSNAIHHAQLTYAPVKSTRGHPLTCDGPGRQVKSLLAYIHDAVNRCQAAYGRFSPD